MAKRYSKSNIAFAKKQYNATPFGERGGYSGNSKRSFIRDFTTEITFIRKHKR